MRHESERHGKRQSARKHYHVNLDNYTVRLGSTTYVWDGSLHFDSGRWYRCSKRWCLCNGDKVAFVPKEKRWELSAIHGISWGYVKYRLDHNKHRKLIRKLVRLVQRERERRRRKRERKRKEREAKEVAARLQEAVLAPALGLDSTPANPPSNSNSKSVPQQRASVVIPKHTKHGTRLYSNDGKHYFNLAVFKSTKYPGCASVQLVVAGKWYNYTLDGANMKALREEASRGGN